jgi:hypothetical protein
MSVFSRFLQTSGSRFVFGLNSEERLSKPISNLEFQNVQFKLFHDLFFAREDMVFNEGNREIGSLSTEFLLKGAKEFPTGWLPDIKALDFEKGVGQPECRKIALKSALARIALLVMEEEDPERRRLLGAGIGRKENNNDEASEDH